MASFQGLEVATEMLLWNLKLLFYVHKYKNANKHKQVSKVLYKYVLELYKQR